MAIALTKTRRN